jgi:class 3 adenylate cyclase
MDFPDIDYATTDDGVRIAYQRWGDGPPLLICPQIISNTEVHNEHEYYRRVREHVGRFMSCVEFDKRGIGLSDRCHGEMPSLETRLKDIIAVLDAVGWESAHFWGMSEGGMMGQLFAAEFPERVQSLTLVNTCVSPGYIPRVVEHYRHGDDPFPLDKDGIRARFMDLIPSWGVDATKQVEWEVPSKIGDEAFVRWMARVQRSAATAADFIAQFDNISELDAGDAPERITVPTLVQHVKGDQVLTVAMGRLLAELIPDAEYQELEGDDHFAWMLPDWRLMADRFIEFATGVRPDRASTRAFGTVLFTDIVNSTRRSGELGDARWSEILHDHDRLTRRLVEERNGRVIKSTGDGLLALFPMPSDGVGCATEMTAQLATLGVDIRAGLHAGEVELHDDGDISGLSVNLAARVEQATDDGAVWVSSTVRDMMMGSDVTFSDQGEHTLKGIDGMWRLFAVEAAV